LDSSRFIPLLLSPPLLPWVSPPLLPWVRDTLILPAIPMSRRPKGRTTKRSNRLVRESQAMAGQVRRMQNDDVWLIGLIQPGQTEAVIGCLNEQAPMQLLYTLMRSPRSCEPGLAETADSHVSSKPGAAEGRFVCTRRAWPDSRCTQPNSHSLHPQSLVQQLAGNHSGHKTPVLKQLNIIP